MIDKSLYLLGQVRFFTLYTERIWIYVHNYPTRNHGLNLYVRIYHTLRVTVARERNKLTADMKTTISLSHFKFKLKSHLLTFWSPCISGLSFMCNYILCYVHVVLYLRFLVITIHSWSVDRVYIIVIYKLYKRHKIVESFYLSVDFKYGE